MRLRLALLLALAPFTLQAQTFSSLEERMSEAEFKAAGLDKLSPEELAALNDWLRGRAPAAAGSAAPAAIAAPTGPAADRRGFSSVEVSNDPIVARIAGEFTGWNGSGKEIRLENGMVWRTNDPSSRLAVGLTNPFVVIQPGALGAWYLRVEGYNTRVRVERVK